MTIMMTKSGLSKSVRKFIRIEKARIRAQFFDSKKQEEMIGELYKKFTVQPTAMRKKPQEAIEIGKSKIKEPARNALHNEAGGQKTKTQIKNKRAKRELENNF